MSFPEGANIFIDGAPDENIPPIGITPHGITNLIMGKHTLRLELEGFPPYEMEFEIAYGEEKEIAVALLHDVSVALFLRTDPTGADVTINGENYGFSPVKVELAKGHYLFKLVKTGYQVLERWVDIEAKPTHQFLALRMEPIMKEIEGMVFIPGGEFVMGRYGGTKAEQPPHKVMLKSFYIDRFEVTATEYLEFMEATGYFPTGGFRKPKPGEGMWPATKITWADARAYAKWAHKRLPTESEWELAARGSAAWKYPWGSGWDPKNANSLKSDLGHPVSVGLYPRGVSSYGAEDMAGNVWEWCADWFDENYYENSPHENPPGPEIGEMRAIRGGSFADHPSDLITTVRKGRPPGSGASNIGFRCVKEVKNQ